MKKLLLLLAAVGMIFTACENFGIDDPKLPQIEVVGGEESLSLNFPSADALTKTVTFSSNYDWSVTTSDAWIKVSPESGEAGEECQITVALDRNDSGETRSGKITISIEGLSIDLTVTQSHEGNTAIIPNNEIWYTSSDGKIVTPNATDVFGAKIVSNTYENGKGVIKFDGDVTQIGQGAFLRCLSLTSVVIPDSVTSIGVQAFFQCTSLTSIAIPHNVTTVGNQAFIGCLSLEAFYGELASEDNRCLIVDGVLNSFAPAKITEYTIPNGVASIGDNAFSFCSKLTKITIPDGVTSIGGGAFSKTALTNITIPDSVTSIGVSAFSGCTSLAAFYGKFASEDNRCLIVDGVLNSFAPAKITEYTIPDGVTSIGNGAFQGYSSLTSVTIPDSVTSIGHYAFDFCRLLASVSIGNSVISIGNGAFNDCTSLKEVYCKPTTPPSGGEYMFMYDDRNYYIGCKIYVPTASVEAYKSADYWKEYTDYIEGYDFEKGEVIAPEPKPANNEIWYTSSDGAVVTPYAVNGFGANIVSNTYENGQGVITFDGPVTKIGGNAFSECVSLTSIIIPDSVTSIGDGAFQSCSSLISITIPNNVTEIGQYSFSKCSNLTAFYGKFATEDNRCLVVDNFLYAFAPAGLTEYVIPDNVIAIIGKTFEGCCNLTNITIGKNVKYILSRAFYGCSGLTNITIPDSVIEIRSSAFNGCTSLTSVTIGNSVTSIRDYTFYNCTSLTSVIIGNGVTSIGYAAFSGCTSLTSVTIPDSVTSIGTYVFRNCTSLTSVTIPDSVTSIGTNAFGYCSSLTSVTIGNGVASIGASAFRSCTSLTSVAIGNSVTSIGNSSFQYCTSLTSVTIPDSVTSIGNSAFRECSSLTSVTIGNGVASIGDDAFAYCASLTDVNIFDLSAWCKIDFASYGSHPFNYAKNFYLNGKLITELIIPTDITEIKNYAFLCCRNLTSITIPDSVTSIGSAAFSGCRGKLIINSKIIETDYTGENDISHPWLDNTFTELIIGNNIEKIGNYAFIGSIRLASVTIPDSVTSIGYEAFTGCTRLTRVDISDLSAWCKIDFLRDTNNERSAPSSPLYFAKELFLNGVKVTNLRIPSDVKEIKAYAFMGCTSITEVTIPEGVESIGSFTFHSCANVTKISIPQSVKFIGGYAFVGCRNLISIVIPDGITEIKEYTFRTCQSLASITIPNRVTSIGDSAFSGCASLTSVTIPDSVTSIGEGAFYGCTSLKAFYGKFASEDNRCLLADGVLNSFAPAGLTQYIIPNSVTSIGGRAFCNCTSLTSVTIPNSVISIGERAFEFCGKLKEVYCKPITPPTGGSVMFSRVSGRMIYVPTASVNAYKAAAGWSDYADNIVGYNF